MRIGKKRIKGMIALAGCMVMICFPSHTVTAAEDGVTLWLNVVVPAMLPFFIFTNYMMTLGVPDDIGVLIGKPFNLLYGAGRYSAFTFISSVMSGYPMGPKLIGDLYRQKKLSRDNAKRMLTFCSTSGPLFMLGAVGVGMLSSTEAGMIITVSHYLGALINGFAYRLVNPLRFARKPVYGGRENSDTSTYHSAHGTEINAAGQPSFNRFTAAILEALKTLGLICGYIVLFSMVTHFVDDLHLLDFVNRDEIRLMIKGLLEMTVGCNGMTALPDDSMMIKIVACTFLISFGGLSVAAQSMSVMVGTGIKTSFYLKSKLSHACISSVIAILMCQDFMNMDIINTSAGIVDGVIVSIPNYGRGGLFLDPVAYLHGILFSLNLCVILMVFFLAVRFINYIFSGNNKKRRQFKSLDEEDDDDM